MMQEQVGNTMDSTYSADELGQYRSLSLLSVTALVLGLLSPLVLVTPILAIIPLAACGFACLAMAKIGAAGGNLSGVALARCGLALALICGVASYARSAVQDYLYRDQLSSVLEPWLENVREGRFKEAWDQLSPQAQVKLADALPVMAVVPVFRDNLAAQALADDPELKQFTELAHPSLVMKMEELTYSLEGYQVDKRNHYSHSAICDYATQNSRGQSLVLQLQLVRSINSAQPQNWLVDSWKVVSR